MSEVFQLGFENIEINKLKIEELEISSKNRPNLFS